MVDFLRGILAGRLKIFFMFYKIKKAFNAIGVWMLSVFATIMKVLFSQLCCKYFTKKGRRNAEKFLPSLEEQKKAFNKLQTEAIPKRVWSKDFRIWMLQMKEYSLIEDCASQEELAEVLFKPCDASIRSVAVQRCTPTHATILKFVNETKDINEVIALARAVPAAFESLAAAEVFGKGTAERCEVMWSIVNRSPQKATDYINLIFSDEELLKGVDDVVVPSLVDTAISAKLGVTPYLAQLKQYFPDVYVKVRENVFRFKNEGERVFCEGFKLTKKDLSAENVDDLCTVAVYGRLDEEHDALAWLAIGYQLVARQCVSDLIIDNLSFIKGRIGDGAYRQLCEKLVFNVPEIYHLKKLLPLVPRELENDAVERLLDLVYHDNRGQICDLFPFKGWSDVQQEKAVRLLAASKSLPLGWENTLSEALLHIAFEELEIQAELLTIYGNNDAEMNELIVHKLHSRSEIALFCHSGSRLSNYGHRYVQAFQMDESTFSAVVKRTTDDYTATISGYVEKLIRAHAEKWGLSEQNYRDLLQSPYNSLAALLKVQLKKK